MRGSIEACREVMDHAAELGKRNGWRHGSIAGGLSVVPSVSIPSGGGESAGCDPFPSSRNPITLVSARHIRPSDLARGIEVDIKRKFGNALLQIRCPLLITRHIV